MLTVNLSFHALETLSIQIQWYENSETPAALIGKEGKPVITS